MDDRRAGGLDGIVAGFLAGALIGAAAALILTPQSGPSTQENSWISK